MFTAPSTALIPYSPFSWEERFQQFTTSFNLATVRIDSRWLPFPASIQAQILAGNLPRLQRGEVHPSAFCGTMHELTKRIDTIPSIVFHNMDYNGLSPFLQWVDQMHTGKTFKEMTFVVGRGGASGGNCGDLSAFVLTYLKTQLGIEGGLAFFKKGAGSFKHAVAVVECSDGAVVFDLCYSPFVTCFPFGQESPCTGGEASKRFMTVTRQGDTLSLKGREFLQGRCEPFEYCTNVANGEDSLSKYVLARGFLAGRIQAILSRHTLSMNRGVFVDLAHSMVLLTTPEKKERFSFEGIQQNEEKFSSALLRQAQCHPPKLPHFTTPYAQLKKDILTVVRNASLMREQLK